ncbi:hypothetical protein G15_0074 [Enterococcus avium]|nr:hypothetical protein G15_0074 [Enterococcus avium]
MLAMITMRRWIKYRFVSRYTGANDSQERSDDCAKNEMYDRVHLPFSIRYEKEAISQHFLCAFAIIVLCF